MVIFAVFCQIGFQVISLFYRFASLMDREWPNFSRKTTNPASRAAMFLFALIYSLTITFLCKDVAYDLQVLNEIVQFFWAMGTYSPKSRIRQNIKCTKYLKPI